MRSIVQSRVRKQVILLPLSALLCWGRLLDVLIKKNYLLHLERSNKTPSHTVASKQVITA